MFAVLTERSALARDVERGLTDPEQKTLPSSWLYDEVGSALFEVITVLPEYGLTRADAALLREKAPEIVDSAGAPGRILELGSGSGSKTRYLLEAAAVHTCLRYQPIDISAAALALCSAALTSIRGVRVDPIEGTYLEGISHALADRMPGEKVLILFLGSTIGNFDQFEAFDFLTSVRERLQSGDSLLLGADLVKPADRLLAAYDDPLGVTAAFNLNLLARINRELGGTFVLSRFAHEARFNKHHSRIEMHLRSRVAQKVWIEGLGITVPFEQDETIWTESSHKFREEEVCRIGERAGWKAAGQWTDRDWGFSETLLIA